MRFIKINLLHLKNEIRNSLIPSCHGRELNQIASSYRRKSLCLVQFFVKIPHGVQINDAIQTRTCSKEPTKHRQGLFGKVQGLVSLFNSLA